MFLTIYFFCDLHYRVQGNIFLSSICDPEDIFLGTGRWKFLTRKFMLGCCALQSTKWQFRRNNNWVSMTEALRKNGKLFFPAFSHKGCYTTNLTSTCWAVAKQQSEIYFQGFVSPSCTFHRWPQKLWSLLVFMGISRILINSAWEHSVVSRPFFDVRSKLWIIMEKIIKFIAWLSAVWNSLCTEKFLHRIITAHVIGA